MSTTRTADPREVAGYPVAGAVTLRRADEGQPTHVVVCDRTGSGETQEERYLHTLHPYAVTTVDARTGEAGEPTAHTFLDAALDAFWALVSAHGGTDDAGLVFLPAPRDRR